MGAGPMSLVFGGTAPAAFGAPRPLPGLDVGAEIASSRSERAARICWPAIWARLRERKVNIRKNLPAAVSPGKRLATNGRSRHVQLHQLAPWPRPAMGAWPMSRLDYGAGPHWPGNLSSPAHLCAARSFGPTNLVRQICWCRQNNLLGSLAACACLLVRLAGRPAAREAH